MIEHFYLERRCRSLRRGPMGPHMDGFARLVVELGFTDSSGKLRVRLVGKFNDWLSRRRIKAKELNEQHLADFLKARRQQARYTASDAPTLKLLFQHLHQTGVISPSPLLQVGSALDGIVRDYGEFLSRERGIAQITMGNYLRTSRRFLSERFGSGRIRLNKIHSQDVTRFILERARVLTPCGLHGVLCALRSFLGFLFQHGQIATNLASIVPPLANPGPAEPSPTLAPREVTRLLACCERNSYTGKRDYAVLLLLARLGLRGCEVVRLTLDDINWEAGELLVCGKGRRDRLPLPTDVGKALADYLRVRKASCSSRRVFVRHKAPRHSLAGVSTIADIVRNGLTRANLRPKRRGAYLLRHSLATNMLRRGTSLRQIAEILRHQHIRTTQIYAKVDLRALRSVALPWPGGAR